MKHSISAVVIACVAMVAAADDKHFDATGKIRGLDLVI